MPSSSGSSSHERQPPYFFFVGQALRRVEAENAHECDIDALGVVIAEISSRVSCVSLCIRFFITRLLVRRRCAIGRQITLKRHFAVAGVVATDHFALGQLQRPIAAIIRIDLEKARAFVAARQAILEPRRL